MGDLERDKMTEFYSISKCAGFALIIMTNLTLPVVDIDYCNHLQLDKAVILTSLLVTASAPPSSSAP